MQDKMAKCKSCGCEFKKWRSTQKVCQSVDCAIDYARQQEAKKQSREAKAQAKLDAAIRAKRLDDVKPLSWFRAKAQTAFNAFVRLRDIHAGCISCGKGKDWQGQYHAGHFYTRAARPDLAFHPDNCHKQCSQCNNYLSGNLVEYRKSLIKKIGLDAFEALSVRQDVKPTREYYKAIATEYRKKSKELISNGHILP